MGNIRFKCTNIYTYDPDKEAYVPCEEPLTVDASAAHSRIKCPKCSQYVDVPVYGDSPAGAQSSSTDLEEPLMPLTGQTEPADASSRTHAPATRAEAGDSDLDMRLDNLMRAQSVATDELAPPAEAPVAVDPLSSSPALRQDSGISGQQPSPETAHANTAFAPRAAPAIAAPVLQYDSFDTGRKCPLCDGLLDRSQKCTKCSYGHARNSRKQQKRPLHAMDVEVAGFTLWLTKYLSPGMAIQTLVGVLHAVVGVFSAAFALAALAIAFPAGIIVWFFMLPPIAAYVYATVVWVKQNTKPAVPLAFWQRPVWDIVLNFLRSGGSFRRDESLVLDRRNQPVSDAEIMSLPGIGRAEAIDLEGTAVTDAGIARMHGLKKAQIIVLKNTAVTQEGVFRLQQALKRCWIWS